MQFQQYDKVVTGQYTMCRLPKIQGKPKMKRIKNTGRDVGSCLQKQGTPWRGYPW